MLIKNKVTPFILSKSIILFLILLLAFFLRAHNLDVPYADNDEFSQGLTAYKIIKNNSDIYGNSTSFRNIAGFKFGDVYYESISIFSKMPYVYFLGLTIYSIRLASVISGVLTILVFYLFLKEFLNSELKAIIGAFLMSISIWHIILSRWALQSINVPLFLLTSILFLAKYSKTQKNSSLILFSLFAGLGFYTYPTFPPIIFLLTILFLSLHRDIFFAKSKNNIFLYIAAGTIFILIITPYIMDISQAMTRAKGENIFNSKFNTANPIITLLKNIYIHISPINYFIYLPHNYYAHTPRLEYLTLFPFFLIGAFILFKNKNYFILGWWLLGSIIPSLTRLNTINPNRAIILLPAIIIISLEGIYYLFNKTRFKKLFISLLLIILIIEMSIYFPKYVYAKHEYMSLEYGNFPPREAYTPELINKITVNFSNYNNIVLESCLANIRWVTVPFYFFAANVYQSQLKGKIINVCPINEICVISEKALYILCSKNHKGLIYLDQISRKSNATDVQYFIAVLNQSVKIEKNKKYPD